MLLDVSRFLTLTHKKTSKALKKKVATQEKTSNSGIFFLFDIAELIILGLVFLHRNLFGCTLEILNNWCFSGVHSNDTMLNSTT